jgi:endonuclease YncB( thermonuclease family)
VHEGGIATPLTVSWPADFKGLKAYPVGRVVDGDTIVVGIDGQKVKVRLVGVDTPETVHPTRQLARSS